MALYTTWGSVRGGCGHAHQTIEAARRCLARDQEGCREQGGYSDRRIRQIATPDDAATAREAVHAPGEAIPIEEEF